jgi:hypothetical protein
MFVPKRNAAPLPSIRFYLSCDQYLNSSREPIEVAADTMVMTLDDGTLGQIAFSNTDDLATPNPLNIFGDQFLTDSVVTPWITLLTGPTNALVGTAFTLRVNLTENPGFNFSDLAYVILHLEYIFG